VDNVGSIRKASEICGEWLLEGSAVAYWTGGLEFTRSQFEVARFLMDRGFLILLGIEPYCYPDEFNKNRGPIVDHIVPVSFWSKVLGRSGFIFQVSRPLPVEKEALDDFYRELYQSITSGTAQIVVSAAYAHAEVKRSRGPVVEVPYFNFPSTSGLWRSFFR